MIKREKYLLKLKLQEYITTPEGKEFLKKMEEYNLKLDEMVKKLGASPRSKGKAKEKFNRLYAEFIKTEEGMYYHEYFTKVDNELKELEENLGIIL